MTLLGAHVSIAGGYHRAVERGADLGLPVIQIFLKNQVRWISNAPDASVFDRYFRTRDAHPEVRMICAHGSYLYNFASPDDSLAGRSIESLCGELRICERMNIPYLVVHPGSHMGEGEIIGVKRASMRLGSVLDLCASTTLVCIETTAGQGSGIGYRFEHIRDIIGGVGKGMLGACIDTSHIFSAGYDIRTREEYESTIDEFKKTVGFDALKVIHLNDSKGALAARLDRHQHIGEGEIGFDAFRFIMNDKQFLSLPKIIETPKKRNGNDMDRKNIDVLLGLVENNAKCVK
jgi:deoxyribonuclease-4